MPKEMLQWHPAFYAVLQIELQDEFKHLDFENEHMLGTKPKQIDVLVIKNKENIRIKKNIGRIFRKYNLIEYKNPKDYLSIDDFYKCYAYACLFKQEGSGRDPIDIRDITLTFVSRRFPLKLINHWKKVRAFQIVKHEEGIYYILGDIIPIQLLITRMLTKEENLWLRGLDEGINDRNLMEHLSWEYEKNQKNRLYQSAMDIIIKSNKKEFKEAKNDMCEAIRELFKTELEEAVGEAVNKAVAQAVTHATGKARSDILSALEDIHNNIPLKKVQEKYILTKQEVSRLEKLAMY